MTDLDRRGIIELLDRLGAERDADALEAARALHRMVHDCGMTWDDLLRQQADIARAGLGAEAVDQPREAMSGDDKHLEKDGAASAADNAEAARIIDRLLARKNLSSNLREDLAEFKRMLSDGSFDASDRRYVRALAKRLGV